MDTQKLDQILAHMEKSDLIQEKLILKMVDLEHRVNSLVTNDRFDAKMNDVITTVDRFAKLHETLDQELVSIRGRYDRLEERLGFVEQKLGIAI